MGPFIRGGSSLAAFAAAADAVAWTPAPPKAIAAEMPPAAFRTPLRVRRCSLNVVSSSGRSRCFPCFFAGLPLSGSRVGFDAVRSTVVRGAEISMKWR